MSSKLLHIFTDINFFKILLNIFLYQLFYVYCNMALRIRKDGTIICAAMKGPEEGDTYINDGIHYYLSVLTEAIIASDNHKKDALWFWNIKENMKEHYIEITK